LVHVKTGIPDTLGKEACILMSGEGKMAKVDMEKLT